MAVLSLIAATCALFSGTQVADPTPPEAEGRIWKYPTVGQKEPRIMVFERLKRLEPAKISPQHKWEFEWVSSGLGRDLEGDPNYRLRVRVFNQMRRERNDRTLPTARMAMRMWEFNRDYIRLDHAPSYNSRTIDFYLCFGGKAGGEQRFDEEVEGGLTRKVNTIYVYDLNSFTDPVEMAREIAHEYGHATLMPAGGFEQPEDWANGYLGEKIHLRWFRNALREKKLIPDDVMGATLEQLDAFVKREVDPIWTRTALMGPDLGLLKEKGARAMDAYIGLVIYMQAILPTNVFSRSLVLGGSYAAADLPNGILNAIQETESVMLTIPEELKDRAIWLPVGKGQVTGGAIVKRAGDWVQFRPGVGVVRITPKK